MQKLIILCAFFAIIAAAPLDGPEDAPLPLPKPKALPPAEKPAPIKPKSAAPSGGEPIPIVRSEMVMNEDGSYNFMYEGGDGNYREEAGSLMNAGTDDESMLVIGSYKYIDSNGEEVNVQYTADENGFVPVGNIISKTISDIALAAKDLPDEEPGKLEPARPLKPIKPKAE